MQAQHAVTVVVLATGGTIAGLSAGASPRGYVAAQVDVQGLLNGVAVPDGVHLRAEQVAQIDSKDMTHEVWQALARRCAVHLADPKVAGVVVTHGTDTMEETAYFLHRVLAPSKPIVLVGAMRPADAPDADGPRNLADGILAASQAGARGVVVAMGGCIHDVLSVRKWHPSRQDAFDDGLTRPMGRIDAGRWTAPVAWPDLPMRIGAACLSMAVATWPRVAIVTSHAGVDGGWIDAMVSAGVDGLVVETTGNGTLHVAVEGALQRARARGVAVRRVSRCPQGVIADRDQDWAASHAASAAKARIELLLELIDTRARG